MYFEITFNNDYSKKNIFHYVLYTYFGFYVKQRMLRFYNRAFVKFF